MWKYLFLWVRQARIYFHKILNKVWMISYLILYYLDKEEENVLSSQKGMKCIEMLQKASC